MLPLGSNDDEPGFEWCCWYAELKVPRTKTRQIYSIEASRSDLPARTGKTYRNPVIYALELEAEMLCDNLTRKQLAERHGISSDRVIQWLCLLNLPEEKQREIEALGDHWNRRVVTERELRRQR